MSKRNFADASDFKGSDKHCSGTVKKARGQMNMKALRKFPKKPRKQFLSLNQSGKPN